MYAFLTQTAIFDIPLQQHQAVDFKKPICSAVADLRESGQTHDIAIDLFYNRDEETGNSENRYPLIQYKSIDGRAAITAIDEGIDALHRILELLEQPENKAFNNKFLFNKQTPVNLSHHTLNPVKKHQIGTLPYKRQYVIHDWLPLDSHRYNAWTSSQELIKLAEILDECLPRQINNMLIGTGYTHSSLFIAHTTSILATKDEIQVYHEKKVPFDCIISCNLDLPEGIGIGQSPGIGYGRIFKM